MTKHRKILCILFFVAIILGAVAYIARYEIKAAISTTTAKMSSPASEEFPNMDTSNLSSEQRTIIRIAREEYAKKPISFDENVLTYSQGVKEPWCANFVSWLMKESELPLKNPHSGDWRIPGVYTLQEYYIAENRYKLAKDYTPSIGDVAIYIGNQTSDPSSQEHTALVISLNGDTITTLGGNEGGRMRITTQKNKEGINGLVGYGVLSTSPTSPR